MDTAGRIYLTAIFAMATTTCTFGEFTYKFSPPSLPLLTTGQNRSVELSMDGISEDILVLVESTNQNSVRIFGDSSFPLLLRPTSGSTDGDTTSNVSISFSVMSVYVGASEIKFEIRTRDIFSESPYRVASYPVSAENETHVLRLLATYVLMTWLVLSYITMGTKITWSKLKPKFYRPHGILIGIACQFIIMPGLAFLLAKMLNLEPATAVGTIIVGSCPGGWLSNVFTALLDCDLILSLTMTFCSTILALGFMPLNMFFYSTPFIEGDDSLKTPFGDIILQLVLLVIPVFIGIFITFKFPKFGSKLSKFIKPFAFLIIVISLGFGIPGNLYVFQSPYEIWIAAFLLPLIGSVLGLLIAKITCLPNRSAVTVSLETGAQNSFLAVAMATLSYPQPASALIGRPPLLVAVLTLTEGTIVVATYLLMTRFPGKPYEGEEDEKSLVKKRSTLRTLHFGEVGRAAGTHVGVQTGSDEIQHFGPSYMNDAFSGSVSSISRNHHGNHNYWSAADDVIHDFSKHYI